LTSYGQLTPENFKKDQLISSTVVSVVFEFPNSVPVARVSFIPGLSSRTVPVGTEDVSHQTSALPAFFHQSRTKSDWDEAMHLTFMRRKWQWL